MCLCLCLLPHLHPCSLPHLHPCSLSPPTPKLTRIEDVTLRIGDGKASTGDSDAEDAHAAQESESVEQEQRAAVKAALEGEENAVRGVRCLLVVVSRVAAPPSNVSVHFFSSGRFC